MAGQSESAPQQALDKANNINRNATEVDDIAEEPTLEK